MIKTEWFVERGEKTGRSQCCRIRTESVRDVLVMVAVPAKRKEQVTRMRQECKAPFYSKGHSALVQQLQVMTFCVFSHSLLSLFCASHNMG